MARLKSSRIPYLPALVLWSALVAPAYSACTLPDGPDNTLVPEGYHFPASGKWKICDKGAWVTGEAISDARPFTANNTGVCLPLENQFTKKNGVISMNFVSEKSRRNFYGFEHECVASTWWRVPGGATVSNPNLAIPDEPPPAAPPVAKPKSDSLADLDNLYDDVKEPAQQPVEEPPAGSDAPPAGKEALPSFSASETVKPEPIPVPAVPDMVPPPVATAPVIPSSPDVSSQLENDYRACLSNCRLGQAERLRQAEQLCKREIPKPGQGKWNSQAEKNYRRCRLMAARKENSALRSCLMPCKKQAGKDIWTGP